MVKMGKITISDVVNALKKCVDPELGINIVDIGLIYGIDISENNDITVKMTMTSPMCPVTTVILADVQLRLEELEGVGKVSIDLVWDPMWSPDMMNKDTRASFGV